MVIVVVMVTGVLIVVVLTVVVLTVVQKVFYNACEIIVRTI